MKNLIRALLATGAACVLSGCTARAPTWTEQTASQNHQLALHGRGDRVLSYRDSGAADADRPALLLIHGLTSSKATWRFVAPSLSQTHRVITVDLLGHGESSAPQRHDYSMAMQAGLIRELIDALELRRVVLIGSSYGGGTALEACASLSAGNDPRLAGLVLIGAAGLSFPQPEALQVVRGPLSRFWVIHVTNHTALARSIYERAFHDDRRIPESSVADCAAFLRSPTTRAAMAYAAMDMFDELTSRGAQPPRYRSISCPVMLLRGADDIVVPADVLQRLAALLPHAAVEQLTECGHLPQEEQPEQLTQSIQRFLAGIPGADSERRSATLRGSRGAARSPD